MADKDAATTRRGLLAAALGGVVSTIAVALGRPVGVRANDGDAIHIGDNATGTQRTDISITPADQFENIALVASFNGGNISGSGILGYTDTRAGVEGWGPIGVWGGSNGISNIGVKGTHGNYSWLFQYPDPTKTGVYGISISEAGGGDPPDPAARGVYGRTDAGHGVHGRAGIGVGGYFYYDSGVIALQTGV
jgi:hypothetical protein